jgi:hypothetical protein
MFSQEYRAAIDRHNRAVRDYLEATSAYRAMRISDSEFLAARKEYEKETKLFDEAYNLERNTK